MTQPAINYSKLDNKMVMDITRQPLKSTFEACVRLNAPLSLDQSGRYVDSSGQVVPGAGLRINPNKFLSIVTASLSIDAIAVLSNDPNVKYISGPRQLYPL